MKNFGLIFFLLIGLVACQNNKPVSESECNETAAEAEPMTFGETITADGAVGFDALMAQLNDADTVVAKVTARVESVCQKKGCWMNVVDNTGEMAGEIFVRFKDYGFFMPMDLMGSDVVMEGKAFKSITSVEDLRHYAEDEGLSEEEIAAITEPEEELAFMANGVLITNRVKAE